jgi:hypothetical protein
MKRRSAALSPTPAEDAQIVTRLALARHYALFVDRCLFLPSTFAPFSEATLFDGKTRLLIPDSGSERTFAHRRCLVKQKVSYCF